MKNFLKFSAAGFLLIISGGCAGVMTRDFPDATNRLTIGITDKSPSYLHDWPPGAYQIPKSNVFVSNTQGGEETMGAAFLFGIAGREIAGGDIAGGTKKKILEGGSNLGLDFQSIVKECLRQELEAQNGSGRFSMGDDYRNCNLQITPYLVFNMSDDDKARLWTVLRVELVENNFNLKVWLCRYIVGLDKPRPFTGENGWNAGHGRALEAAVAYNLKIAIQTMLGDFDGKIRNNPVSKDKLCGRWVFYKKPHEADVRVLRREDGWDVVLPMVDDDEFFAGINVLPKDFPEPQN